MAGKSSFNWIYAGIAALVLLGIVAYGIYAFGQSDTDKSKYTFRTSVTNDCTGTP